MKHALVGRGRAASPAHHPKLGDNTIWIVTGMARALAGSVTAVRWSLASAIVACTPPAAPVAPAPPPAKLLSFAQPVRFAATAPVARYAEPLPAPTTTSFDAAVIAATHAVADAHLYRACADLLSIATPDAPLDAAALELAWTSAGIIEPVAKPLVVRATDPQAVIAALGTVSAGSHIGIARAEDLVVVAVTTPVLTAQPFARSAPIAEGFAITAKLAPRFAGVDIDVTWDDHATLRLSPIVGSHAFSAQISCQDRAGHGRVLISGVDHATSVVLARFPIWCGIDPPSDVVIDPLLDASGDTDTSKAAHRMFLLLQRDRVAAGLPALAWDDRAASAALEHAEDLRDGVRAGTAPQFRKTTFTVPIVVSNMTRAATVDEAYAKMMKDPGRRANAMSVEMTGGGIGIAGDHDDLYVAQVFVSVPAGRDTAAAAASLEHAIVTADPSLTVRPLLSSIAAEIATVLRAGGSRDDLDMVLYSRGRQDRRLGKFYYNVVEARDLGEVDAKSLVAHAGVIDFIGVGVVQGHHPRLGDNALWIVSVMARDVTPTRMLPR